MRVYQGGNDRVAPVSVKVRILDAAGKPAFSHVETMSPDRFDASRAADYQLRLPLATLGTGDYLLSLEASAAKTLVRRDIRFQVR